MFGRSMQSGVTLHDYDGLMIPDFMALCESLQVALQRETEAHRAAARRAGKRR